MKLYEYETPIREMGLLLTAIEGVVASGERIVEMYGHDRLTDVVSLLIDESEKRRKLMEGLYEKALECSMESQK